MFLVYCIGACAKYASAGSKLTTHKNMSVQTAWDTLYASLEMLRHFQVLHLRPRPYLSGLFHISVSFKKVSCSGVKLQSTETHVLVKQYKHKPPRDERFIFLFATDDESATNKTTIAVSIK